MYARHAYATNVRNIFRPPFYITGARARFSNPFYGTTGCRGPGLRCLAPCTEKPGNGRVGRVFERGKSPRPLRHAGKLCNTRAGVCPYRV